jgi:superfamily II RNA helicase
VTFVLFSGCYDCCFFANTTQVELKKKTALQQVVKESTMEYIPDEADIDPRYSFAMDGVELEREADDIIRGWPAKMPWVRAVKRGIGIHHASLPTKYRQAVERLFRVRAMQVVFATSTLSLGINMPCKTVIFAGDHVGLNAVSFRQMSGRAGRRGFDKLGRVLFFGVPMAKINRLLTGDLPSLQGNFPSTTSLVQRCTRLMEFTKDKELACDISSRLFGSPLSPFLRGHTDFYFRFSIEYLLRKGNVRFYQFACFFPK